MDYPFAANPVAPPPEAILSHSQLLANLGIIYLASKQGTELVLHLKQTTVLGEMVGGVAELLLTSLGLKLVKQMKDEFKFLILGSSLPGAEPGRRKIVV